MKHLFIALAVLTALSANAQIGSDAIAKQRARDVANQNNNRSLETSGASAAPARPAAPAAPAVTATPMNGAQQAYASFQSALFAVHTNASDTLKDNLTRGMSNVAQGTKPSQDTLSKLTEHLSTALGEAVKLTSQKKTRLAQDIGALLNSASRSEDQKKAMIEDVQSILHTGGASDESTAAVATDLQSVAEELKPAAK
jgi:hypothetical protein